ncbi:hypothetical protein WICPIJ_001902 [Wickerhamomyces pijperi]|uniref:Subtelomeric hrmA-associated cluster protein AFUB-079030/YDR124W-like helical bundle domain-containing protein n=1 Tax=Wickerhamomyces pijperi TaxID=599730 RepID=A0A9P8TQ56_WICPI|nr:hypothetical protein WICPIJ_001902 [Wickerhamomyces pijperi]
MNIQQDQNRTIEALKFQLQTIYETLDSHGVKNIQITEFPTGEVQLWSNFPVEDDKLQRIKRILFSLGGDENSIGSNYPSTPSPSSTSSFAGAVRRVAGSAGGSAIMKSPAFDQVANNITESDSILSLPIALPTHPTTLTISNTASVQQHFRSCFREIQQLTCKSIAKEWIKIIEPKKQTRHPYKEGDSAKPKWWPDRVKHLEPDHLLKNERITLLVSIISSADCDLETLDLFKRGTDSLKNLDLYKRRILDEVYLIAGHRARVAGGLVSGEYVINVSDFEGTVTQEIKLVYSQQEDQPKRECELESIPQTNTKRVKPTISPVFVCDTDSPEISGKQSISSSVCSSTAQPNYQQHQLLPPFNEHSHFLQLQTALDIQHHHAHNTQQFGMFPNFLHDGNNHNHNDLSFDNNDQAGTGDVDDEEEEHGPIDLCQGFFR